jgi:outer membrane protein OmpA-like peptidoglycan-associated protein
MPRAIAPLAGKYGQIYSATLGLSYRFNKRGWDRAYTQEEVDTYLAAIAALEVGLIEAQRTEGKLTQQLAEQEAATKQARQASATLRTELKAEELKPMPVTPVAIFFNINSARLSDRAKATMQLLCNTIAEAPKDQTFTIIGHADPKTGSPSYNQSLSEKRAKAVYDYLISKGIDKSRLSWRGVGATDNIFPINGTNRVVIVK